MSHSQVSSRHATRRVYRAGGTTWAAIGGTVGTLIFLLVAIFATKDTIAGAVVAAFLALMSWRMWNVGIQVGAQEVRVVTFFLTRRVPWSEIDRFAVMPLGRYPYVGYVIRRGGRKFPAFGLSTSSRARDGASVQRPIDELNTVLAVPTRVSPDS